MAHLYRLIFLVFLSFGGASHAAETCTSANYPFTPRQTAMGLQYGTWVCGYGGRSPLNCGYTYLNWANSSVVTVYEGMCTMQAAPPQCEGGRERDASGQCVCKAGTFEPPSGVGACLLTDPRNADRDACASFGAVNTLPGGALVQDYRLQGNIADGSQYCMPGAFDSTSKGCKVSFSRDAFLDYGGSASVTEGTFSMSSDASTVDQSCTIGTGNTPSVPQKEKCASGYTGTVNGVEVCVNKVPDNGVGGTTETTEETKDNETKKVTKDTQTECKNGVCTTTTTTTTTTTNNTTGTVTTTTGTATTTKPQAGFCSENPSSKLCGSGDEKGSSFGGTCGAGFTCEGDAIQCAMAQEQHRRACKLFDNASPESALYNDNKGKTGNQTTELPGNETISLSGRIDTSDAIGGASCVGNVNVTVWGRSVSLPFSDICPYLAMLGNVLVAVSMLMAARIVFRG